MIERLWRGWTTPEKADDYQTLLTEEILPKIRATVGDGYLGHRVLRRREGDEVAFLTVLQFDSMAAVERFAGPEPEVAHVPEAAQAVLARWQDTVEHYEVVAKAA